MIKLTRKQINKTNSADTTTLSWIKPPMLVKHRRLVKGRIKREKAFVNDWAKKIKETQKELLYDQSK